LTCADYGPPGRQRQERLRAASRYYRHRRFFLQEIPMSGESREVVVVDVRIPFWSMVVLLVKWTLAAIPAIIILFLLATALSAVLGSVFHMGWMSKGMV
jgi:hypothetical protein